MKKKVVPFLLALFTAFCMGCNNAGGGNSTNESNGQSVSESVEVNALKSVEEVLNSMSAEDGKCAVYDAEKYLAPIWENQIIYNETVMFRADDKGEVKEKKLAYPIAKILEVRSADLKTVYTEGVDYEVTAEGNLKALDNTSMPITTFNSYYHDTDVHGVDIKSNIYTDKYLDYGEGVHFYYKQVCVTYIRTAEYDGPDYKNESILTKTVQKLTNKEDLKIVFYGDSITTGCNASSQSNSEPNMPYFDKMVVDKLSAVYNTDKISFVNTAVGGWTTEQGLGEFSKRVLANNPDLLVLGFGMNDATIGATAEQYGNRIVMMINNLRKKNPNAEILLLTTMNANPEATGFYGNYQKNQVELSNTLKDIAGGYEGVAVADVNSMHNWLLQRKDYCDMTGNNVNHPSDFLVRLYAQIILSQFL